MGESGLNMVSSGEAFVPSATRENAWTEVARWYQQQRANQRPGDPSGRLDPGLVLVKNASGADRLDYEILGVSGPIISSTATLASFQRTIGLLGVTPSAADHTGRFVVLSKPIKNGELGYGWVFGACPVQINIVDAGHKYADVKDGDATQLQSAASGAARILAAGSGTGTQWAYIRIGAGGGGGGGEPFLAVVTTDVAGGICKVEKLSGNSATSTTGGGDEIADVVLRMPTGQIGPPPLVVLVWATPSSDHAYAAVPAGFGVCP